MARACVTSIRGAIDRVIIALRCGLYGRHRALHVDLCVVSVLGTKVPMVLVDVSNLPKIFLPARTVARSCRNVLNLVFFVYLEVYRLLDPKRHSLSCLGSGDTDQRRGIPNTV